MAIYVVTWQLSKERPNFTATRDTFLRHLGRYENVSDGGFESVRWISTNQTVDQISGFLKQHLDYNDRLFVSGLAGGQYYGWLNHAVWEWIKGRQ